VRLKCAAEWTTIKGSWFIVVSRDRMRLAGWLKGQGYWVPAGAPSAGLTHVFLNGGKARVPAHARSDFLDVYADAVHHDERLYVVERALATYRMFADLDVRLADGGCERAQRELEAIIEVALSSLPQPLRRSSVSVSVRGLSGGKTGAHLVWEDAVVDDGTASALRGEWVAACLEADPSRDWGAIIDAAVYKRSGLRMPWSWKMGTDRSAVYVPWRVARFGEDPADLRLESMTQEACDVRSLLAMTTLHAEGPINVHAASVDGQLTASRCQLTATKQAAAAGPSRLELIPPRLEAKLRRVLADAGAAELAAAKFTRAALLGRSALIVHTDSRFCRNVGREHRSNHVYLLAIRNGGLHQCCFSASCGASGKRCKDARRKLSSSHPFDALIERRAVPDNDEDDIGSEPADTRPSLKVPSAATAVSKWASCRRRA
jgi:hypothetical protein